MAPDRWSGGDDYESYVGRWSRRVAVDFVDWLALPAGLDWLDLGCGTGALTATILARSEPASVLGVDPSPDFVGHAAATVEDGRARFATGDAGALPVADGAVDAVVSGLVLNFVPDVRAGLAECRRATRPSGTVAAYVWDYADGMQPIRAFWDAAAALDPAAGALDEAVRFPLCAPDALRAAFTAAGLEGVETTTLDAEARFAGFDDYWRPFLSGVGPAPGYCASLDPERREALRALLADRLPVAADGALTLRARAFACRGQRAPNR
jgi:SAM-dependent methyltransferase